MKDPLSVYLQDHWAGSVQAVELIEFLRDQHKTQRLGAFSAELVLEIRADQRVLRGIAGTIGDGPHRLKEVAAWFAEKISLLKLRVDTPLGTFEALFWASELCGLLSTESAVDERLEGTDTDFKSLVAPAEAQYAQVEILQSSGAFSANSNDAIRIFTAFSSPAQDR